MINRHIDGSHLQIFLVATLILILLTGCYYLLLYPRATAALEELEKEHLGSIELRDELEQLKHSFAELQGKYDRLLQEKEKLEALIRKDTSTGETVKTPRAYLTIDDGPDKYAPRILQILAEHSVPATFFVIGRNDSGDEHIYRHILEQGHALGNHTMTHNLKKIYQSKDVFMDDLLRLEDLLEQQAGIRPDIIRFPGGSSNTVAPSGILKAIIAELKERGYDYFDWNISTGDCNTSLTAAQLVANVVSQADRRPGQDLVVLMHDFNPATAEALPQIIKELQQRGYTFAALKKGAINMKHR